MPEKKRAIKSSHGSGRPDPNKPSFQNFRIEACEISVTEEELRRFDAFRVIEEFAEFPRTGNLPLVRLFQMAVLMGTWLEKRRTEPHITFEELAFSGSTLGKAEKIERDIDLALAVELVRIRRGCTIKSAEERVSLARSQSPAIIHRAYIKMKRLHKKHLGSPGKYSFQEATIDQYWKLIVSEDNSAEAIEFHTSRIRAYSDLRDVSPNLDSDRFPLLKSLKIFLS